MGLLETTGLDSGSRDASANGWRELKGKLLVGEKVAAAIERAMI
jgi:hypothetical protein